MAVQLPAVQVLRKVWVDQYVEEDGQLRWRSKAEMPAPASQGPHPTIRRRDCHPANSVAT